MKKKYLSLCDGIAVALSTLEWLAFPFDGGFEYHAVEIDPVARLIADSNYKGIKRPFNDVREMLAQIKLGNFNEFYDGIFFGFPCTSLSTQGPQTLWKGESGLFWDCILIVNHLKRINPNLKIFVENVKSMPNICRDEISKALGVDFFYGNSALTSAQERERYYWFNWKAPKLIDKGLFANTMLDDDGLALFAFSKSNRGKDDFGDSIVEGRFKQNNKAATITTGIGGKGQSTMNQVITKKMKVRDLSVSECARLMSLDDYRFEMVSAGQAYHALGNSWERNMIIELFKVGELL